MATIHSHPRSPYWMAHFFKGGIRTTKSTRVPVGEEGRERAQQIADAWETAAQMAGEGRDGRQWMLDTLNEIFGEAGLPTVQSEAETWQTLSQRWLATAKNRRQVAKATLYRYEWVATSFGSFLGRRATTDIVGVTSKDVDRWVEVLHEQMTAGTVRARLNILRGAFHWAVKHGIVSRNPAAAVEMPISDAQVREPFSAADVQKMLTTATTEVEQGRPLAADMKTLLLLGLCTGARLMDCAAMRWDSVDLKAAQLAYVPRKKKRFGKVVQIQLVDPLLAHLRSLAPASGSLCPGLATRPGGSISVLFADFVERAGVKGKVTKAGRKRAFHSKTFHSLRHTLATMLAEAGVDDLVRRRITDHEDKAVAAIYQHVSVEATGRALSQVLSGFR